jgi:hypothetical protein
MRVLDPTGPGFVVRVAPAYRTKLETTDKPHHFRCKTNVVDCQHGQESSTGYKVQSEAAKGLAINQTKSSSSVGALDGGDRWSQPISFATYQLPRLESRTHCTADGAKEISFGQRFLARNFSNAEGRGESNVIALPETGCSKPSDLACNAIRLRIHRGCIACLVL